LSPRRLNVGCGSTYRPGYVNIDITASHVADLHATATALPFTDGVFQRVDMIHVIEHLGYAGSLHALAEAWRVLEPNGMLVIETPEPEGSFKRFLDDESRTSRAQLLSWIFGLDAPGYAHRLLYPADLLRRMLDDAGFEALHFEKPMTHLYAPGQRVTARKAGLPVHGVLAGLRRWIRTSGGVDLSHQLHALDFERVFIANALALGGASPAPGDPIGAALANIMTSPAAAVVWLELMATERVRARVDCERLTAVARAAEQVDLAARMAALLEGLVDDGTPENDGWSWLRGRGMSALVEALSAAPGKEMTALATALPEPVEAAWLGRRPVIRSVFEARVAWMHDRAVGLLCKGRYKEATKLLEQAARSRIHPFYPLWNLAVAHAAAGRLDQSIGMYLAAIEESPPETMPALTRETVIACMHAGKWVEAADFASRLPRGPTRRKLMDAARRRGPPLPPLRTRPVISGESYHHEPDPE